jgi:putative transposase
VKFRFVEEHRETFRIRKMCEVLEVSRSGFYAWLHRQPSGRAREDDVIAVHVREVHRRSHEIYGSPRIYAELREEGKGWGRHRVARIMREEGLRARCARRFRWIANKREELPAAPDLLRRKFQASAPNQAWVGDITIIRTGEGWLHLAMLLDLFSRKVVGWATSANPRQELALEALRMAIGQRQPRPGLIHHSDRGGQYSSAEYQNLLDRHGMRCSMSRPGNCLDNAVAESFFHTLKTEWIYHAHYKTRREARLAIFEYIEGFYNTERRHSSLDYRSPEEYEREQSAA